MRVGSRGAGVDGSSVGTGCARVVPAAVAWLLSAVALSSGRRMTAVKVSVTVVPGATMASVGVVVAFQVMMPPASWPPWPGITLVRLGSIGSVTTRLRATAVPVLVNEIV